MMKHPQATRCAFSPTPLQGANPVARQSRFHGFLRVEPLCLVPGVGLANAPVMKKGKSV